MKVTGILVGVVAAGIGFTAIRIVTNEGQFILQPEVSDEPVVYGAERDASSFALVEAGRSPAEQLGLAIAWADIRDPKGIKNRLDQLHLLPSETEDSARAQLLLNWIQIDPAAACRWCERNTNTPMSMVLAEWSKFDPDGAIAYAETITNSGSATAAYATILDTLSGSDVNRAYAFLEKIPTDIGHFTLRNTLQKLAEHDPHALISRAENQPPEFREAFRAAATIAMIKHDPDDALEWWMNQPDREALSGFTFWTLPSSHWKDAISLYSAAGVDEGFQLEDLGTLGWAYREPSSYLAMSAFFEDIGSDDERALYRAAGSVAAKDPLAALRWYQSQFKAHSDLLPGFSKTWKRLDTPDALTALAELGEVETPKESTSRQQAAGKPETASEYFLQAQISNSIADTDWIDGLPISEIARIPVEFTRLTVEEQRKRLPGLVVTLTGLSPSTAAEFLTMDGGIWSLDDKVQRTANLASTWTSADPLAASSWATSLPENSLRELAVAQVALQWKLFNPEAASSWAQELPSGAARAAALEALGDQ